MFFSFLILVVSFYEKKIVLFWVFLYSFEFFVFLVVLIELRSGFQKNILSSFSLGLIWFGYSGTFLYMRLV